MSQVMALFRDRVVDINNLEYKVIAISEVHDHGIEVGDREVGLDLDSIGLEEGLAGVDGHFAGIIRLVFGEMGVPLRVEREAFLFGPIRVGVGMDGGDGVEPQLLND